MIATVHGTTIDELRSTVGAAVFARHWEEAGSVDLGNVDVDWDHYLHLESQGMLLSFLAESPDGRPIGYAVVLVCDYPLADYVCARCLAIYVDPEKRSTGAGLSLIRAVHKAAGERGCAACYWSAERESSLDHLMAALGHKVREVTYEVEL